MPREGGRQSQNTEKAAQDSWATGFPGCTVSAHRCFPATRQTRAHVTPRKCLGGTSEGQSWVSSEENLLKRQARSKCGGQRGQGRLHPRLVGVKDGAHTVEKSGGFSKCWPWNGQRTPRLLGRTWGLPPWKPQPPRNREKDPDEPRGATSYKPPDRTPENQLRRHTPWATVRAERDPENAGPHGRSRAQERPPPEGPIYREGLGQVNPRRREPRLVARAGGTGLLSGNANGPAQTVGAAQFREHA